MGFRYPVLGVVSTFIKIPGLILIQHRSRALIWISVLLRVLIGSLGGVFLNNFKKILAYSRVGHGG
jgi:NADH:ubiquinone oxidoreductase subunit 2 (subunit N)